jgi:general stress protein 26
MTQQLTSEQVWTELNKEIFAVLGMVTSKGEARTVGVVYIVHDRKIYISTGKESWKAKHVDSNPHVSLTVPIAKRIPIMPWIKIPAATITFSGTAKVLEPKQVNSQALSALLRGLAEDKEQLASIYIIEVEPVGDFITYGVGVRLIEMRDAAKARGRAPVA